MRALAWIVALGVSLAAPMARAADPCADLWFSRNAIFAKAGYCFGSTLGQSIFGNGGCFTKSPDIGTFFEERVARLKAMEQSLGCRINTRATGLPIWQMGLRFQLDVQPVADGHESACRATVSTPVRSGPDRGAAVMGRLFPGDTVYLYHEQFGPFTFASEVIRNGQSVAMIGWFDAAACEIFAG